MEEKNQIVVYQPNDTIRLEVRYAQDSIWLPQIKISELFGVQKAAISKHLKNIFASGELQEAATVSKMETVQVEGGRTVVRVVDFYNLDAIIAVGYRVNSLRATHFRIWATNVLRNYLLHGYAVNDRIERLERRVAKHDEQIGMFLKTALPPVEGVLFEGQICDAYATAMKIIKSAKKSLVLIDNWLDETVLTMLGGRAEGVKATIYTKKIGRKLQLDVNRYNEQYAPIVVKPYSGAHDRFIIIDGETVYHIGASLKDLGHALFAFSKLQIPAKDIMAHLP